MKILLFARDPGGANTIMPLIRPLKAQNYEVLLCGKDIAIKKFESRNLECIDFDNILNEVTKENIEKFVELINPDLVITATSAEDKTEKTIWSICKKKGILSYAILDQWINYGIRFSEYGVSEIQAYEKNPIHNYLPSKIFVMDEKAKNEMIKLGFDSMILYPVGQPHFHYLKSYKMPFESYSNKYVVTYASEPITLAYKSNDYWGYTEKTIFLDVYDSIRKISEEYNINIELFIRQHPKEERGSYDNYIGHYKFLDVKVENDIQSLELISKSDLVIGMSSMFLIEAIAMNKQVISYQKGLKILNPYIFDRLGVDQSIFNRENLENQLKSIIVKKQIKEYNYNFDNDVINNILEIVKEDLCLN